MAGRKNLDLLGVVVDGLGDLADQVVFVGGAIVNLLVTDPAAPEVRVTDDVDLIVELMTRRDYWRFEKALQERGFKQDESPGAPICRWVIRGVRVDAMPTDPSVIGFSSRWYPEVVATAVHLRLPGSRNIRCASPACFLATKFEAFKDRGNGDYQASHDIEDIIVVVDGRSDIAAEVENASNAVRMFLGQQSAILLDLKNAEDIIAGHLLGDNASQARLPEVMSRLERIRALG